MALLAVRQRQGRQQQASEGYARRKNSSVSTTPRGSSLRRSIFEIAPSAHGGAGVTNAGLNCLTPLTRLQWLDLNDTRVNDDGLLRLRAFTGLNRLQVHRCTLVTDAGVAELQKALPNCRIEQRPRWANEQVVPAPRTDLPWYFGHFPQEPLQRMRQRSR